MVDAKEACVFLGLVEQVGASAHGDRHLSDEFFSDCVKRRVRDLCKVLLEIGEKALRFIGQRSQRCVVAH